MSKSYYSNSPLELKIKKDLTKAKLARRAKMMKERELLGSPKELAAFDTRQAGETIKACREILHKNLGLEHKVDWASFYDDSLLPPYIPSEPPPRYELVAKQLNVPRQSFWGELFFPSRKKKRLQLEEAAKTAFQEQLRAYQAAQTAAQAEYEAQKAILLHEQAELNRFIDQLQLDVEKGRPAAVAALARIALSRLAVPDNVELGFEADYNSRDKILQINGLLPEPDQLGHVLRYEYQDGDSAILPVAMDEATFNDYYESTLLQIALSAVQIIFTAFPDRQVRELAFNGLTGEDPKCILTCHIKRESFAQLDLAGNDPKVTFRAMGGVMHKPLTALTPVASLAIPSDAEQGVTTALTDVYRPGEIKKAADSILVHLLDEIENDFNPNPPKRDLLH
ncbi:MAG: hypothetical protein ACOX0T_07735 [Pelotomaculum sp.]|jgi:hypothetical protein